MRLNYKQTHRGWTRPSNGCYTMEKYRCKTRLEKARESMSKDLTHCWNNSYRACSDHFYERRMENMRLNTYRRDGRIDGERQQVSGDISRFQRASWVYEGLAGFFFSKRIAYMLTEDGCHYCRCYVFHCMVCNILKYIITFLSCLITTEL